MIFPGAKETAPSGPPIGEPAHFLASLFATMVAAADPRRLVPRGLPDRPRGRTVVVGAGKAAAAMARAVEENWAGDLSGLVVTRYGHGKTGAPEPEAGETGGGQPGGGKPGGGQPHSHETGDDERDPAPRHSRIEVVEAGHPLPDDAGAEAARRMLAMVRGLSRDDLVLALLSGGGSALLTLPAPGLTLVDLREVNRRLLASGAPIAEINCLRKHLSAITGGRLATAAWPARVVTLAISDVPGDDPAVIASGPTVGDPSTFADALEISRRRRLVLPDRVMAHLREGRDETPKPGDPRLARSRYTLLATPATALQATAAAARQAGVEPVVLGAELQGEARLVAAEHAALARRLSAERSRPLLILSGGETTVTLTGSRLEARGGRNAEYLLALALALEEGAENGQLPSIYALAADTDGIDGSGDNAGALLFRDTLARARSAGIDPRQALDSHDSYGFFASLGDLLTSGPTGTNVNDFRAILIA